MSIGVINIVNAALIKAGCDIIASLDQQQSKNARIASITYDIIREELLRLHPWNFAKVRSTLAPLTAVPLFEYGYQYQIPADCIRVLHTRESETVYKIEGRFLLCDEDTLDIVYISNVSDTSLFDATFRKALILRLAAEFAASIKIDTQLQSSLSQQAEAALRMAKQIDGQEQTADMLVSNTWTYGE